MSAHNGLPVIDLTDTFDQIDPASLAIAAWDNHPNAMGHHRLFQALGGGRRGPGSVPSDLSVG